jgi:hypothetical protein
MSKYFSVNVCDETGVEDVRIHSTLEEAKEACLKDTECLYELACDSGTWDLYESLLENAVYGVVLGHCESATREPTEEERLHEFHGREGGYIIESPRIVEHNKDGWISVEDNLPKIGKKVLIFIPSLNDNSKIDIAWLDDGRCNDGFCFVGSTYGFDLPQVTHWRPLPAPPIID